jgi:hypothetical protein
MKTEGSGDVCVLRIMLISLKINQKIADIENSDLVV